MRRESLRVFLTVSLAAFAKGVAGAAPVVPPSSGPDWLSGAIGMVILAMAAYFVLHYARLRGLNARKALRGIGVEFPEDAATAPPDKSAPPPPPLPPLSGLAPPGTSGIPARAPFHEPDIDAGGARLVGLTPAVADAIYSLEAGIVTIGREGGNTIPLPDDNGVSRRHARIEPKMGGDFVLIDENSQNGIFVNDVRTQERTLQPGDEIQIGSARFRFER